MKTFRPEYTQRDQKIPLFFFFAYSLQTHYYSGRFTYPVVKRLRSESLDLMFLQHKSEESFFIIK